MNKIYRLVWSTVQRCWCVASEFAHRKGKSSGGTHSSAGARGAMMALGFGALTGACLDDAMGAAGSTYEQGIDGNPGIYLNDGKDAGCQFVHDTGKSGDMGWKYDGKNTNCKSDDKASQTGRVLFYGTGTQADGTNSLTLGNELYVNGGRIVLNNQLTKSLSMAIGDEKTFATGKSSIAIGNGAISSQDDAIALGSGSVANIAAGIAGYVPVGASAEQAAPINATQSTLAALSIGDASNAKFRQITGLAAGSADSDAVNVAQLKGVVGSATADAVMYDDGTHNHITLGGDSYDSSTHTGGTTITNVANGVADSDAVNVSQLNDLANTPITFAGNSGAVDKKLGETVSVVGGGATDGTYSGANLRTEVDASGNLQLLMAENPEFNSVIAGNTMIDTNGLTISGGPSVTISGIDAGSQKIVNVAAGDVSASSTDAINGSQLNATNQNIANITNNIDNGTIGPVQRTGTDMLSLIASGGGVYAPGSAQVLTNVAAGAISASSTDAINGSQLYATNQQVDANTTNITNLDGRVTTIEGSITNISNGAGIKYFHANSTKADSVASGVDSVAVGPNAQASGKGSIAMGEGASASADGSLALGQGASDNGRGAENYTGKYSNAANASVGTVSVGNAATGETRTISNVADGKEATDAVNLRQLDGAVAESKKYTDDSISQVNTSVVNMDKRVANVDDRVTHVDNRVTRVEGEVSNVRNGTDGMFQVNDTSKLPKPKPTGRDSVAGGAGAVASGDNSVAMGTSARATAENSVALGNNSLADRANSVSVGSAGAERQITHVAAGTADTDAVNVAQLNRSMGDVANIANDYTDKRYNELKDDLAEQDDTLSAGIAGAMAMATLPQPYEAGASMASVATSTYRGQGALAVGVSRISDNGKWVTKLQGSTTTQGDAGVSVGVGYQW
ncbi:YadA-like family protein [Pseudomonas schmalbachii]|uniref:YadA-like family protein n=1 Tax=Pseudomonas schmalbachii TaxID=2816993 RepID=A0ABS3TK82_9PSED|nr:YadA-like family protein [Pseudomonas schmalbachii]MBO3274055.1 YadA-like family protein [Pseudomonas schmalbachii]